MGDEGCPNTVMEAGTSSLGFLFLPIGEDWMEGGGGTMRFVVEMQP